MGQWLQGPTPWVWNGSAQAPAGVAIRQGRIPVVLLLCTAIRESHVGLSCGGGGGNYYPKKVFKDNYTPPTLQNIALLENWFPGNASYCIINISVY